ncbi:MAG: indole-3-glycerol phosphate synthase TrpC [Candidatus Meridianibacter frigidus]|nr:MAG: indole-3-glycerol phosphate synthase TrpC [Candidatus Eremiobacteraeota bacterium]
MTDILQRIFAAKTAVRERDERREPYDEVSARASARVPTRRPFRHALEVAPHAAVIGEIKRASPSAGLISRDFDPAGIARSYEAAGVDAISVLTESDHFLGELTYLEAVRSQSTLPILRKDFLSSRYEIAQSAAYGADAVLLIVAGLTDESLRELHAECRRFALDILIEVHDASELGRASALNADLIGINNRNLRTFETELAVSDHLIPLAPKGATIVSESGMSAPAEVARLYRAGAKGFLIGEALMRAPDRNAFVAGLRQAAATLPVLS